MIYNHRYNGQVDRTTALAKIASLKNEIGESFTLIDVGGWAGSWVNEYHTHIYKTLSPALSKEEARWLKAQCKTL